MRCILSVLLENESGALSRVVGLFAQRGYNIESLTVAPTEDATLSRMTIQTIGDDKVLEQIEKQLHKLINVLKVNKLRPSNYIEREIILMKIRTTDCKCENIKYIIKKFRGQIIDLTMFVYTLQLVGSYKKINEFIKKIINISDIIEIVRSGIIGISRDENIIFNFKY
ncbi:MAG: acetolactate synthase small subunit [Pantoea sp. Brub]|nr:acetolactate synthase small subunit [Pantoea sp. Brub]